MAASVLSHPGGGGRRELCEKSVGLPRRLRHSRLTQSSPSFPKAFALASAAALASLVEYEMRCAAVISRMRARLAYVRLTESARVGTPGLGTLSGGGEPARGRMQVAGVPANEAIVPFESLQFCVRDFVQCASRCGDAVWCAPLT